MTKGPVIFQTQISPTFRDRNNVISIPAGLSTSCPVSRRPVAGQQILQECLLLRPAGMLVDRRLPTPNPTTIRIPIQLLAVQRNQPGGQLTDFAPNPAPLLERLHGVHTTERADPLVPFPQLPPDPLRIRPLPIGIYAGLAAPGPAPGGNLIRTAPAAETFLPLERRAYAALCGSAHVSVLSRTRQIEQVRQGQHL